MGLSEILMLVGALVWFVGEVAFAVFLHRGKTTTFYVRRYTGNLAGRFAVVAFAAWFVGHMLLGWPP